MRVKRAVKPEKTAERSERGADNPTPMDDLAAALRAICTKYDIRGIADETFTERHASALGNGFAAWCAKSGRLAAGYIVVGRDCRVSGERLSEAFIEGILDQGCDVVDIGLASTDMLYAASGQTNAPGAMLTASHNPAQYNGIKLTGPGAAPLSREHGIGEIIAAAGTPKAARRGTRRREAWLERFVELILGSVDTRALRGKVVAVDAANGMGALIAPAILDAAGIKHRILYGELDGKFPNHPANPLEAENLRDLQAHVLREKAWAGIAFDGDADRAFLVDGNGAGVSGSTTTALVAEGILRKTPGERVLHNLICSRAVRETIEACGGTAIRTPVGHSIIKRIMAETGAVFGGEHSAHYYFKNFWRADSGIMAALHALTIVAEHESDLVAMRGRYEPYVASGEINHKVAEPAACLAAFEHAAAAITTELLDGVSFDAGKWWGNVRGSNTEPFVRVNIEAVDDGALAEGVAHVNAMVLTQR